MNPGKTFFEKVDELKDCGGTIELNDSDRKDLAEAYDRSIEQTEKKKDEYIWFLIGIGVSLLGNIIAMLFYDWLKIQGVGYFLLMSGLIVLMFLLALFFLYDQLKEYRDTINLLRRILKIHSKAKSIKFYPAVKSYDKEEFKELQRQMKAKDRGVDVK